MNINYGIKTNKKLAINDLVNEESHFAVKLLANKLPGLYL